MYGMIVVPLDGSGVAEQAVTVAADLASRDDGSLRIMHVHVPTPTLEGAGEVMRASMRASERAYVERVAREAAERFGIEAVGEQLDGDVAQAIVAEVARLRADLVVMTTHGRTGFSRFWLGSVADAVMNQITVPVLMLRPAEEKRVRGRATIMDIRQIVVAVDGSPSSEQVLPHAVQLGGAVSCRYLLARVVEPVAAVIGAPTHFPPARLALDGAATEELRREACASMEKLADRLRSEHPGLHMETIVRVAPVVAEELLAITRERNADVLAIATRGRGLSRFLLGSVADKLLRGGTTAMLVLRPVREPAESGMLDDTTATRELALRGYH